MFPNAYAGAASHEEQVRLLTSFREPVPSRWFDPSVTCRSESFEDDLMTLLARLEHAGIRQAIAVDLTRSDVGIPVVKVVVPGLETLRTPLYRPGARAQTFLRAQ